MNRIFIFCCCILLSAVAAAQVPTNGLVAEYLFTNGSYDDTNPNGQGPNHAVAPSTVVGTADRFGNANYAKDLAGVDAYSRNATYITLGTSNVLKPREATISIWVNVDQISNSGQGYAFNPIILATNTRSPGTFMEAYSMYVRMSNRQLLTVMTNPSPVNEIYFSGSNVPDDTWHHYVLTYDDNTMKTYMDGVLLNTKSKGFNSAGTFSNEQVRVGSSMNWNNNRALDGAVDDIQIYNRVLSDAEVMALFQEANPVIPPAYATVSATAEGGYVPLVDDQLRFKFVQDYALNNGSQTINYTIYPWNRQNPVTGTLQLIEGHNYIDIDVSALSPNSYYTLEFESNKDQAYRLKFKTK